MYLQISPTMHCVVCRINCSKNTRISICKYIWQFKPWSLGQYNRHIIPLFAHRENCYWKNFIYNYNAPSMLVSQEYKLLYLEIYKTPIDLKYAQEDRKVNVDWGIVLFKMQSLTGIMSSQKEVCLASHIVVICLTFQHFQMTRCTPMSRIS